MYGRGTSILSLKVTLLSVAESRAPKQRVMCGVVMLWFVPPRLT